MCSAWKRSPRTTKTTIQGIHDQGSRIAEMRATYSRMYGDNMYADAARKAGLFFHPKVRSRARTPMPAMKSRVPVHSRWATQSGTLSCSKIQYQGPCGRR